MPYPPALVDPMREELTRLGVEELRDAEAVDRAMQAAGDETMLAVVNSVCGCAAANARPAVRMASQSEVQPDRIVTVFAGQDLEATERLRSEYLPGIPPSSPFFALFKDGEPVFIIERRQIEGRSANAIAQDLVRAFESYCGNGQTIGSTAASSNGGGKEASAEEHVPSTFRSIM